MIKNKKAEALTLSTIVIAALVLLVLIILSVIFVGRMGKLSSSSNDCEKRGATCYSLEQGVSCQAIQDNLIPHPDAQCMKTSDNQRVVDDQKICCITAG